LSLTAVNSILLLEVPIIMTLLATIVIYCAAKINAALKNGSLSYTLRKLHRQILILLLLQTACPLVFLHGPCFVAFICLFLGVTLSTLMMSIVTIPISLFPLFCPIIIVAFLKDYRHHTLFILRIWKRAAEQKVTTLSKVRTTINGVHKVI
ncbi:hypothetical protein GCK32_021538, partial [Trichostrongylus colubriformis]